MKNIGNEEKLFVLSTCFAFPCDKSAVGNKLWDLGSFSVNISYTPCGCDVCFYCYKFQIITEDRHKSFSVFQIETSSSSDCPLMTKLSLIVFLAFHLFSFTVSFTYFPFYVYCYFLWRETFAPLSHVEAEFSWSQWGLCCTNSNSSCGNKWDFREVGAWWCLQLKYYFKVFMFDVVNYHIA